MKSAIFQGPCRIEVHEVPEPVIKNPDEAIVKVTIAVFAALICGSIAV